MQLHALKKSNMKNLVLDLRGNGGGYMLAATELADKFFSDQKLLVYLDRKKNIRDRILNQPVTEVLSSARLVVLTDEGSASASEILAGAMQDWDRGVILGRRTFGKGLGSEWILSDRWFNDKAYNCPVLYTYRQIDTESL